MIHNTATAPQSTNECLLGLIYSFTPSSTTVQLQTSTLQQHTMNMTFNIKVIFSINHKESLVEYCVQTKTGTHQPFHIKSYIDVELCHYNIPMNAFNHTTFHSLRDAIYSNS